MTAWLSQERAAFHTRLVTDHTLSLDAKGVASNADRSQRSSRMIAACIAEELGASQVAVKHDGQHAGKLFEDAVAGFVAAVFPHLQAIRPGAWTVTNFGSSRSEYQLAKYSPYLHLDSLADAVKKDPTLSTVLGNSYSISPDVVVVRAPEPDSVINRDKFLVDDKAGTGASIRADYHPENIVHAVVSCKWTLRSDRAQNARSEALSLIRNRKGRTPHICVVTAEPSPSRLASLALGTGDIDAVYHFALPELQRGVEKLGNDEASSMLDTLVSGNRLKDIADLPLDLAI